MAGVRGMLLGKEELEGDAEGACMLGMRCEVGETGDNW